MQNIFAILRFGHIVVDLVAFVVTVHSMVYKYHKCNLKEKLGFGLRWLALLNYAYEYNITSSQRIIQNTGYGIDPWCVVSYDEHSL